MEDWCESEITLIVLLDLRCTIPVKKTLKTSVKSQQSTSQLIRMVFLTSRYTCVLYLKIGLLLNIVKVKLKVADLLLLEHLNDMF